MRMLKLAQTLGLDRAVTWYCALRSDNRGRMQRRDNKIRKQPCGDPSGGEISALYIYIKISGFSPLLRSPPGCFLISSCRCFIPPLSGDLTSAARLAGGVLVAVHKRVATPAVDKSQSSSALPKLEARTRPCSY